MINNSYQPATSIAWISLPRTGTNYICELLHNHYKIISHYEIFHKHKFYARGNKKIISLINDEYSRSFLDYKDISLIKWIHDHPDKLFTILKKSSIKNYFSFKIFPGQLETDLIKKIIIGDNSIKKILIKRNLLDVYISKEIALKSKKWGHIDTSKIQVKINFDEFLKWFNWVNEWYQLFENELINTGQNFSVISYEGLHCQKSDKDKFIYLINFLRTVGINLELQNVVNKIKFNTSYKKQDQRANIANKIIDYVEFKKKLHNAGLEYLLYV